jgi:hypothetical protein
MNCLKSLSKAALSRIPHQLHRSEFRFVRIESGQKKPFEPGWNVPGSATNYSIQDAKFLAWVGAGQNYGVVTGIGGLIVFDADGLVRLTDIGVMAEMPATFAVRTGGGGLHLYYSSDLAEKLIMYDRSLLEDGKPQHLGEVQSRGFQAVGPGSLHPNGNYYKNEKDLPIANLEAAELHKILSGYVDYNSEEAKPEKKRIKVIAVDPNHQDPFDYSDIESIMRPVGNVKKTISGMKGAHPVHGSTSGNNFEIDTRENTWRCWRCGSGGGPALAVAVKEGILRCDQARAGVLRGDLFLRVVDAARKRGYIGAKAASFKVERVL